MKYSLHIWKTVAAVLLLALLLALSVACSGGEEGETADPGESSGAEIITVSDDAYLEIERQEPKSYEMRLFSFAERKPALALMLPSDWEIKQGNGAYVLEREGMTVGTVIGEELSDGEAWKTVASETFERKGVKAELFVERSLAMSEAVFRYRVRFLYGEDGTDRTVTLTASLSEVSDTCKQRILKQSFLCSVTTDAGLGMLSDTAADESVLIIGNSFVNSSQVGTIFEEMCALNGKSTRVRWISRGYATVATYAWDDALMNEIRSGNYGAVFLCGFYSEDEIDHMKTVKAACDASDTALVLFPAHNESESAVTSAARVYDDDYLLDWKGELDALIEYGVSSSDLCVNDAHMHSTPIAGYIGAQMIYRAIFGTLPSGSVSQVVTQRAVESALGDYTETGTIPTVEQSQIFMLG